MGMAHPMKLRAIVIVYILSLVTVSEFYCSTSGLCPEVEPQSQYRVCICTMIKYLPGMMPVF